MQAGVYQVTEDLWIEKQYGEWRIIDDAQSFTFGFPTLRAARAWLTDYLETEQGLSRDGHS